MFNIDSLWLEIALASIFYLSGHLFMGHFAERDPRWRKFAKSRYYEFRGWNKDIFGNGGKPGNPVV